MICTVILPLVIHPLDLGPAGNANSPHHHLLLPYTRTPSMGHKGHQGYQFHGWVGDGEDQSADTDHGRTLVPS